MPAAQPSPGPRDSPAIVPIASPAHAYEEVVERLVALVGEARLRPGDRLPPERRLAHDLGVSRSTLRQALTVLRVIGLVEIRHGVGIHLVREVGDRVPPIADASLLANPQIPAVKDLREALESHAAWLAAERRGDGDLAELASANEQMAVEISSGGFGLGGDRRFHAAILAAARSPLLEERLAEMDAAVRALATASLSRRDQPPRSLDTHRLIFGAIVAGDRELAHQAMLSHLLVTGEISQPP